MSSVFVEPDQSVSQTSDMMRSRVITVPALPARRFEEVEFLGAQFEFDAGDKHSARVEIDFQVTDRQGRGFGHIYLGGAAGRVPRASSSARRNGLRDVVVGAGIETDDDVGLLGPCRDHNDLRFRESDREAGDRR